MAKSLTPSKAGNIYGKLSPSPLGRIRVGKEDGSVVELSLNRKERRRLGRRARRGRGGRP